MVRTILVVEDEPDMSFLLGMILQADGYEVVETSHGAMALARVQESAPDLVITDLMMPVMNGRELIARLRSDATTAAIPILVVSANPNGVKGVDALLSKPFRPEELLERVRALIGPGGD